jgi:hypothetical protein
MAPSAAQTPDPDSLEHVAERALAAYRRVAAENERLVDGVATLQGRHDKVHAKAQKAIALLRQTQVKLKAALKANAALESRTRSAEERARTSEERVAAAQERAAAAEEQAAAALAHARRADHEAEVARAAAEGAEGKMAIEGRLRRIRAGRRPARRAQRAA